MNYPSKMFYLLAWAVVSVMVASSSADTPPAAAASTTVAPAHPFLADGAANANWHAPATSDEAVFIGDAGNVAPMLTLTKASLEQGVLELHIQSDAKECVLSSGLTKVPVPLDVRDSQKLVLDGDPIKPSLTLDGRELAPLKGRWIVLFLKEKEATITLTFTGATFVNLKFVSTRKAGAAAGAPAGTVAVAGAVGAGVGSRTVIIPANVPQGGQAIANDIGAGHVAPGTNPKTGVVITDDVAGPAARTPITGPAASGDLPGEVGEFDHVLAPVNEWDLKLNLGGDLANARFYRGIGQENQNLVVKLFADASIILFENKQSGPIDSVSIDSGIATHHYWGPSGGERDNSNAKFVEMDGYGGLTIGFLDRWSMSAFPRQRVNINQETPSLKGDVHSIDLLLKYDDASEAYDWKLSPHFLLSFEYEGQSDLISDSDEREDLSVYFEMGVRPQFELWRWNNRPVHLSVPVTLGLSFYDYYQDPATKDDDLFGFLEVGLELSGTFTEVRMAQTVRTMGLRWHAGVYFLYLGDNAAAISERNGTSGDAFNVIAKIGFSVDY